MRNTEEGGKNKKTASMFVLYILGVSVMSSKASSGSGRVSSIEFNIKDYYAIQVRVPFTLYNIFRFYFYKSWNIQRIFLLVGWVRKKNFQTFLGQNFFIRDFKSHSYSRKRSHRFFQLHEHLVTIGEDRKEVLGSIDFCHKYFKHVINI